MKRLERKIKWISLVLMFSICQGEGQYDWSWSEPQLESSFGEFPARKETVCERSIISIRCPGVDVIEVVSAEYGRQNGFTCSGLDSEMENKKCSLPEAKDIMETKCNNKTECTFEVTSTNFPDPCPGTYKYLIVTFNCVKFMFSCPGSLTRIGREETSTVNVQPQSATWTKDPLYNKQHVFFAPPGQIVHEYSSWDDFVAGKSVMRYVLPSNMAQGNMVVYDRDLYYVKASSRSVIRYSLMTRKRTKETVIAGTRTSHSSLGGDISIAADENGLWVIYTQARGVMTISKLKLDQLTIEESWTTNLRMSNSLHTFVICGVIYSVSPTTGKVDYSYNTNLNAHQQKRNLNIGFDSTSYTSRRRSFISNSSTSLSYNPRDKLLYAWDASNGNAVYYKLHFDGQYPTKANIAKPTTTAATLTTTSRRRASTTTRRTVASRAPVPTRPEVVNPDVVYPDSDSCPPTTRGNINWPKTSAGDTAKMSCMDGTGEYATWNCVRQPSMREAEWSVAGPDLAKCMTWASDIEAKFTSGLIGRATALESLSSELSKRIGEITGKSIVITANLMKKLLEKASPPSQEEARKIAESATKISSVLLKEKSAWDELRPGKQSELANTLMTMMEKAGFLYAETVAPVPADIRDNEPLIVFGEHILMEVEVREQSPQYFASKGMTSFPDEKACMNTRNCGQDVIKIPDSENGGRQGPLKIVFGLYQNIGDYLSPGMEVDSRVISATLHDTKTYSSLSSPAVIILQHKKPSSLSHRCVYWDYSESTGTGNWSDDGCRMTESNGTHTTCECTHLSSFAVVINRAVPYHDQTLDIVTKIGISIAIVCLMLCVLTFSCFRNLHNDRNTIHKHMCICLLIAEIVFMVGINQTQNKIACSIVAGLLHYFFLATFLWMALEGFQLYVMLIEVFDGTSRWKWYYLTGYGIPALIVGISAGVDHNGYGTDAVCWLQVDSGFIWSFVGPVSVIILANLIFLSMTVYNMYVHTTTFTDSGKINSIKASVRGASVLLCLLGITWAFGILWISEEMSVLAYLFCVFNAFQGMFIFVFHCLLPRKVRDEYGRCFGGLPCCQKLRSESYVANSMSFSKQYTPGRYPSGTNGGTQQTSINGHSQLRRMWNETVVTPKNSESMPITTEVAPSRDASRTTGCPHRVAMQHPQSGSNPDQRPRHEDDVFLPSEHEIDSRPESVRLLQNQHGEIDYDRLQYYRCPDHCAQENTRSYPAQPAHFHNGASSPPRHVQQAATLSPGHNPQRFEPPFHSQHRRNDLVNELVHEYEPTNPQPNRRDAAHPYYWELDPPLSHHHVHQSSLEDSIGNGKRDSGISMQHLPPNSMMHRLAGEMQRCDVRRPRDSPNSQPEHGGSSHSSQAPIRSHEEEPRQRFTTNQKRQGGFSDDEGQGSSYDDPENAKMVAPRCAVHAGRVLSPPDRREKSAMIAPDQRRRNSITSESDDPIVTDCSASSAGSSFGRPYRHWANQENLV